MTSEILVINRSDVKLRKTYDVINDILYCCAVRWISKTNIYSYINLMHSKRYLVLFLVDKGLLDIRMNPSYRNSNQFKISGKGIRFCKLYSEMVGLLK